MISLPCWAFSSYSVKELSINEPVLLMIKYQFYKEALSEERACTRSRDRTGTALLPLVFETSASTNSAIRAKYRDLRE